MARPVVNLYRLGKLPYVEGLRVQQVLFDRLKAKVTTQIDQQRALNRRDSQSEFCQDNSLLLLEHEPVYTIGLRTSQYNADYEDKLRLELEKHKLEADFHRTNRGGLITFHGPGQLVAYPILYLGDFKNIRNRSVKAYVNSLEATIIDTLARVGLVGAHTIQEYPGVWLDGGRRKIAFVGIACKRFVTMHGISINCDCDLSWFDHIVSCGIEDRAITSIHREMLSFKNQYNNTPTNGQYPPLTAAGLMDDGGRRLHLSLEQRQQHEPNNSSEPNQQHHLYNLQKASEPQVCVDHVGHVSKTFCETFSQIFNCSLLEKQKHELDHEIAKN